MGRADVRHVGELIRDLATFGERRGWRAVWAQQPCVHLFLGKWRLPPAEIADGFGTMCKCLPRPKTGHTWQRRWVVWRPVHRAGLLFHDPHATAAHGAVQVVVECLIVGMALAQKFEFFLIRAFDPVGQKADGVAVP